MPIKKKPNNIILILSINHNLYIKKSSFRLFSINNKISLSNFMLISFKSIFKQNTNYLTQFTISMHKQYCAVPFLICQLYYKLQAVKTITYNRICHICIYVPTYVS